MCALHGEDLAILLDLHLILDSDILLFELAQLLVVIDKVLLVFTGLMILLEKVFLVAVVILRAGAARSGDELLPGGGGGPSPRFLGRLL